MGRKAISQRFLGSLFVALLFLYSGQVAATDLALSAPWGYQYAGSELEISVDRITNLWSSGTSGSLRLELWAFGSPYQGGRQKGHRMGSYQLDPLQAGSYYYGISSGVIDVSFPSIGIWYITLLLTEYRDGTFFVVDYLASDSLQTMVCSDTSCEVVSAEAGAASVAITTGRSAYEVDSEDTLTLSAAINAGSDEGTPVDIYISASLDLGASFFLTPNREWDSPIVPLVENFPLASLDAPGFYAIPIAGLGQGNYQFSLLLTRAGTDPSNQANRLAYSATTTSFQPAFRGSDVALNPGNPPVGEVGRQYLFDFYPFASGGLAPYYFTLETAQGFPPIGLVLAPDGKLTGTPTIASNATFSVCAVDIGANQSCTEVTVYVQEPSDTSVPTDPGNPGDSGPDVDTLSLVITAANCSVGERFSFGTIMYDVINAYGTASGPLGASLSRGECDAWTNCERGPDDPPNTAWTYTATTYVASPQTFLISLFSNSGSLSQSEPMACPTQ